MQRGLSPHKKRKLDVLVEEDPHISVVQRADDTVVYVSTSKAKTQLFTATHSNDPELEITLTPFKTEATRTVLAASIFEGSNIVQITSDSLKLMSQGMLLSSFCSLSAHLALQISRSNKHYISAASHKSYQLRSPTLTSSSAARTAAQQSIKATSPLSPRNRFLPSCRKALALAFSRTNMVLSQ